MVLIRILALLFLSMYGLAMGQEPRLNGFGYFIAFQTFISLPALYFLPSYEAWRLNHQNLTSVFLTNLFLGWTLLGWLISLIWAIKKPTLVVAIEEQSHATEKANVTEEQKTKNCPYCGEKILAVAIKCKHCGSNLSSEQP
jgi:predicted RNA-binding Zn-ribbon protein involved in translation (DUF1610 family)